MMHSPRHVIELSHNQFILLSGDRDMHYTVSRLSVDANGKADFQKQVNSFVLYIMNCFRNLDYK